MGVRMGRPGLKSLLAVPDFSRSSLALVLTPPSPSSGVFAGMTAAALELRQSAELQLPDLLTVPRAVPTLSGWKTQTMQFNTNTHFKPLHTIKTRQDKI